MSVTQEEFLATLTADRDSLVVRRRDRSLSPEREALLRQCREALAVASSRVRGVVASRFEFEGRVSELAESDASRIEVFEGDDFGSDALSYSGVTEDEAEIYSDSETALAAVEASEAEAVEEASAYEEDFTPSVRRSVDRVPSPVSRYPEVTSATRTPLGAFVRGLGAQVVFEETGSTEIADAYMAQQEDDEFIPAFGTSRVGLFPMPRAERDSRGRRVLSQAAIELAEAVSLGEFEADGIELLDFGAPTYELVDEFTVIDGETLEVLPLSGIPCGTARTISACTAAALPEIDEAARPETLGLRRRQRALMAYLGVPQRDFQEVFTPGWEEDHYVARGWMRAAVFARGGDEALSRYDRSAIFRDSQAERKAEEAARKAEREAARAARKAATTRRVGRPTREEARSRRPGRRRKSATQA
jgi:hypothetical protein